MEHKSSSDYWIGFRLLKYIVRILDQHKNNNKDCKKLPSIYTTVFYNGKMKYNAPVKIWDLFENCEVIKSFFTDGYNLIDLASTKDEDLYHESVIDITSIMMKHVYERDIQTMTKILNMIHNISVNYDSDTIDSLIRRFLCYYSINSSELIEIQKEVKDMALARFAQENYDIGMQNGMRTGIQKGIEQKKLHSQVEFTKKLLSKHFSVDNIVELVELPKDQILKIKSQIDMANDNDR